MVEDVLQNIVVGVDDSEGSRAALDWAAHLACQHRERGSNTKLTMVAAWSPPTIDTQAIFDDAPFRDAAEQLLDELSEQLPPELDVEAVATRGQSTEVILSQADALNADLIVVGTRGRSSLAQVLLGSVSRSVAARAGRPVAIVPVPTARRAPDERMGPAVVGYDDSDGSRAAMHWAVENLDGPITAVAAWVLPTTVIYDPLDLDVERYRKATEDRLLRGLTELGGDSIDERITPVVEYRDPRIALVDPALKPSSIVIGARSRSGIRGLLLGSTVTYVASHSPVPVIVVPPEDDPEGSAD